MAEYDYVNGVNVRASEGDGMVYLDCVQAPPEARTISEMAVVAQLVMPRHVVERLAEELSKFRAV